MNDLNLLDRLPNSVALEPGSVWGRRLLWGVLLSGLLACTGFLYFLSNFPSGVGNLLGIGLLGVFLATWFLSGLFFTLVDAPWVCVPRVWHLP